MYKPVIERLENNNIALAAANKRNGNMRALANSIARMNEAIAKPSVSEAMKTAKQQDNPRAFYLAQLKAGRYSVSRI